MESDEFERYIRTLHGKSSEEKIDRSAQPLTTQLSQSLPSFVVVAIISSTITVIVLLGLAVSQYHIRRQKRVSESASCVRQLTSSLDEHLIPSRQFVIESTSVLKSSFSWPQTSRLHRREQVEVSSSSLSTSLTMEEMIEPASLTFGLRWNERNKSLFVRVISARDLFLRKNHRQPSIIDSYVRLELHSTTTEDHSPETYPSMRTHIIKKNAHPIYDELFEYTNLEHIIDVHHSLLFTISTYDTFTRDEILGQVVFPIQANTLDSTEMTFTQNLTSRHQQLRDQPLGDMLLSLCYQPADSTLTMIVLKASNLPRIGTNQLMNPYFKVYMYYKNQRLIKKRSTIKHTTAIPVYNECFTFTIPNNEIEQIYFDVILFHYDRHMKHETIGKFSIGKEMDQHWNDVCHRQITKPIAHWYPFKSFNI